MSSTADDCPCEEYPVNTLLGPVLDNEMLARIIKKDMVLNSVIQNNALQSGHFRGGWSFVRPKYIDMREAIRRHVKWGPGEEDYTYISVRASVVRGEIGTDNRRLFCVIADPLVDYEDHALVHNNKRGFDYDKVISIRKKILPKFTLGSL